MCGLTYENFHNIIWFLFYVQFQNLEVFCKPKMYSLWSKQKLKKASGTRTNSARNNLLCYELVSWSDQT